MPNFEAKGTPKRLGLLSPNTDRTIQSESVVPDLDKRNLFVYGRITYDEDFQNLTGSLICLRLSDDGKFYQFCEQHNDTDAIRDSGKPN